jgi:hypothetical protein
LTSRPNHDRPIRDDLAGVGRPDYLHRHDPAVYLDAATNAKREGEMTDTLFAGYTYPIVIDPILAANKVANAKTEQYTAMIDVIVHRAVTSFYHLYPGQAQLDQDHLDYLRVEMRSALARAKQLEEMEKSK